MAEIRIGGFAALIALAAAAAFMAFRVNSAGDMRDNQELMRKVRMELMTEYVPHQVDKLAKAIESGAEAAITRQAESLTTAELDIQELKAAYPFYKFSTSHMDVVIKVRFRLSNSEGVVKDGINYYLCEHHPVGNTWYIKRHTSEYFYYSNFFI